MITLGHNINNIINDRNYAENEGFQVFHFRSKNLTALENELKDIKTDDSDWRNKVDNFKRLIKTEKDKNNRFIIRYKKDNITPNNIYDYGLFRSIVTDGHNILSFSPPKSINLDKLINISKEGDIECLEYVEGTMINMYFDTKWKIATRSNIGAEFKFNFDSNLNFREMFLEAFSNQGLEFDMFSKKYSYSFVLQHPENRIVVPFSKANIILTNIYEFDNSSNCEKKSVIEIDIFKEDKDWISQDNSKLIKYPRKMTAILEKEDLTITDIKNMVYSGLDYTIQGAVFVNRKLGIRSKIRNQNYENVRELKGNSPKLQYQYYNLRNFGKVKDYLKYYPEHIEKFTNMRLQLHKWTLELWNNYFKCYVKKEKPLKQFPFEYRTHMYQLHRIYINDLCPEKKNVNKKVVVNYVNDLAPDYLMSSINYPLKQLKLREKKMEIENEF